MTDLMSALPRTTIGTTTFYIDEARPVALVRREAMPDLFLTWPDLDTGILAPDVSVCAATDALWVLYQSGPDGQEIDYPALHSPTVVVAVRIGVDGSLGFVRTEETTVVGATSAGLWTSTSIVEQTDDNYRGGELPADWAAPSTLQILLPGQVQRTLEVDRYVNAVREDEHGHVLFVNPSPPVAHHDSDTISYEYRCTAMVIGTVDEIPEHVKFREFVPQGWGTLVASEQLGLDYESYGPRHDSARVDLSEIAGTHWKRVSLTDAQKTQAVKALTDQFADADAYWRAADGTTAPLADGVQETHVETIGEWPESEVHVTCRHPYFPAGWIRRRIRVFDDAGRIKFDRYASLEFMEDLDTHALPDIREAKDGILEV